MLRKFIGSFLALCISNEALAEVHFTTKCAQFTHPEFQFSVTSKTIPRGDVEWFVSVLESMVAAGERFKAGETMQVGWMLTMIQNGDRGTLKITEPDMKSLPIKFVDSVDATIKYLRSQKDSIESVMPTTALTFPSLRQSIVVHLNYKQSKRILLERTSPQETDSGWWLSDIDDKDGNKDPAQFARISLYQLGLDRPDLIKFLAFPPDSQIIINRRISVLKDGRELPIKTGSFLDLLNRNEAAQ